MTNAGKTFTIQGNSQYPGVMPRLVNAVLERMGGSASEGGGGGSGANWEVQTSMLEIYQEKIYDLLCGKAKKDKLSIRDANGRVEVQKLSYHPIASSEDALRLMDAAAQKRSKSNTSLNTGSSRSHAVYSLTLKRDIGGGREVSSVFQVVDLAGAERGSRTKATSAQQKEANNINMSLMQLWRCLQGMKRKVREFCLCVYACVDISRIMVPHYFSLCLTRNVRILHPNFIQSCIHIYTHQHTHAHTHSHINIHTHTNTHTLL